VVAFLDESILNLQQPVFAQWHRKPLQEELFGIDIAGEIFFNNIQRLLGQRDSHDLADVLEIYELCLLLGFRGRYGLGGQADLRSVIETVKEKLRRIRGYSPDLSPYWAIPPGKVKVMGSDPWVKRLFWTAIASFVLVIVLFGIYKISLGAGASELRAIPTLARG
jgi:type VI secretion system protein ImpK